MGNAGRVSVADVDNHLAGDRGGGGRVVAAADGVADVIVVAAAVSVSSPEVVGGSGASGAEGYDVSAQAHLAL